MKKIIIAVLALVGINSQLSAQALTASPAGFSPSDSVEFIIDVKQCTNQSLLDYNPDDVYLWTWLPEEGGRPAEWAQGAWTDSNPNLKLKYKGDNVWSFKMVPTAFYGVSEDDVYAKDFAMLLKSKDGSKQTEDLKLAIDAPAVGPKKVYLFPQRKNFEVKAKLDDVLTIFYDKSLELKPTLLATNEFSVFCEAVLDDSTTKVRYCTLKQVGDRPELRMKDRGDGTFSFTFIPNEIFAPANIPTGRKIEFMQFKIVKTVPGNIVPSLDETVEDALQFTTGFFVVKPIVD